DLLRPASASGRLCAAGRSAWPGGVCASTGHIWSARWRRRVCSDALTTGRTSPAGGPPSIGLAGATLREPRQRLTCYLTYYNNRLPPQARELQTPAEVYFQSAASQRGEFQVSIR